MLLKLEDRVVRQIQVHMLQKLVFLQIDLRCRLIQIQMNI